MSRKFPEGWTIETTWGPDLCGCCGDIIENCKIETCPFLQDIQKELDKKILDS